MDYTAAILKKPENGDWYVYYSYRSPVTGKLKPFKIRGDINRKKTIKEKLSYGNSLVVSFNIELKKGYSPFKQIDISPLGKLSILELFDEFLKIKKLSVRKPSYTHYKYGMDVFKEYLKGVPILPIDFNQSMAQSYSDYLITDKKFKGRNHNNHIETMKTLFNMAIERELIVKNPFKAIKKKTTDPAGHVAYSDVQRNLIRDYLERNNHPMFMFVQFVYYCFIRPKELMLLQIKHIDFKDRSILIPGNISKNRKQSSVEIPDAFFELVKDKYESLNPEMFMFGRGLVPHLIPLHRNRASESHKLVLKELGITGDHTLYGWKHTGNVAAWEAGVTPYKIMEQNRHHSLEQTMTYLRTLGLKMKTDFASKQPKF